MFINLIRLPTHCSSDSTRWETSGGIELNSLFICVTDSLTDGAGDLLHSWPSACSCASHLQDYNLSHSVVSVCFSRALLDSLTYVMLATQQACRMFVNLRFVRPPIRLL
jgi:hypothetical protein